MTVLLFNFSSFASMAFSPSFHSVALDINPDPSLEIYIIRLTLRKYAVETEFFSAHLSMISLRLKNSASPFIFLAKPNSVKFLMTDLGLSYAKSKYHK